MKSFLALVEIDQPAAVGGPLEGHVPQPRARERGHAPFGVAGEPPLVFAHEEQVDVGEHLPPGRERAVADEFEGVE